MGGAPGNALERKKDDCRAVAGWFARNANAPPWPPIPTQPHSKCSATRKVAEPIRSRSIFSLKNRVAYRGRVDLRSALDLAGLALPRPPNLELQYRRMRKACQEKNARYGLYFGIASICSGPFSAQVVALQHFFDRLSRRYSCGIQFKDEAKFFLSDFPGTSFFATDCARKSCGRTAGFRGERTGLRGETAHSRNSQRRKN